METMAKMTAHKVRANAQKEYPSLRPTLPQAQLSRKNSPPKKRIDMSISTVSPIAGPPSGSLVLAQRIRISFHTTTGMGKQSHYDHDGIEKIPPMA
jgi:hypothetical protein